MDTSSRFMVMAFVAILSGTMFIVPEDCPDGREVRVKEGSSIQDAIDLAEEGDTVLIDEGIYYGHVEVDKRIALRGAGGSRTVIDGVRGYSGINLSAHGSSLSGLTVVNSRVGVLVTGSNSTIQDCSMTANGYGAIVNSCHGVSFERCGLDRNQGIGMALTNASGNRINDSSFDGNGVYGISFFNAYGNQFGNGSCSGNGKYGAEIYWLSDSNVFSDFVFDANGIIGMNIFDVSLTGIVRCYCNGNGKDGIDIMGASNFVSDSIIEGNEIGVVLYNSKRAVLSNCTVRNNTEYGIVMRESTSNTVSSSLIMDNGVGIRTSKGSSDNVLFMNDLISEDSSDILAIDDGANSWSNEGRGNFWSNRSIAGPLAIGGKGGASDHHPAASPLVFEGPVVFSGNDRTVVLGETVIFEGVVHTDRDDVLWPRWEIEGPGVSKILEGWDASLAFSEEGSYDVTFSVNTHDGKVARYRSVVNVVGDAGGKGSVDPRSWPFLFTIVFFGSLIGWMVVRPSQWKKAMKGGTQQGPGGGMKSQRMKK